MRNWNAAMREEMDSLIENETFILTTLPERRNLAGGCQVYTIKEGSDGAKRTRLGMLLRAIVK